MQKVDTILGQLHLPPCMTTYFHNMHFNIILPPRTRFSRLPLYKRHPTSILRAVLVSVIPDICPDTSRISNHAYKHYTSNHLKPTTVFNVLFLIYLTTLCQMYWLHSFKKRNYDIVWKGWSLTALKHDSDNCPA
jgi:hypothetical protein